MYLLRFVQPRKSSTGSRRDSNDAASVKSGTSHRSSRSSRSTRPLVSGKSKRDIETGDNLLSNAAGLPGAPVKEEQADINRYVGAFDIGIYIYNPWPLLASVTVAVQAAFELNKRNCPTSILL
jgi:hypothetical protein